MLAVQKMPVSMANGSKPKSQKEDSAEHVMTDKELVMALTQIVSRELDIIVMGTITGAPL